MTDYVDISFDSETWGKRFGDDVRSIGACHFDIQTGEILDQFYLACENPSVYIGGDPANPESYGPKYNLKRDPETVAWWSDQTAEAQAAFDNPVDLRIALDRFAMFIYTKSKNIKDSQARDIRLWTHGPAFDPPIIEGAYIATDIVIPWFYRAHRDTRTAFDFAGVDDHSAWMKKHNSGVLHHALYDSISQAKAISTCYQRVTNWRKRWESDRPATAYHH